MMAKTSTSLPVYRDKPHSEIPRKPPFTITAPNPDYSGSYSDVYAGVKPTIRVGNPEYKKGVLIDGKTHMWDEAIAYYHDLNRVTDIQNASRKLEYQSMFLGGKLRGGLLSIMGRAFGGGSKSTDAANLLGAAGIGKRKSLG